VRISKQAALQKIPERQQVKKLIQGYFSWDSGSFKTLITSRKVSIYCGITFLEVFFKEKEKLILF
jgi:hypothetical protein